MNPLLVSKPLAFGAHVRLKGDHTHAGHTGTYLHDMAVGTFGFRPLVVLDEDRSTRVVVLDDHQWELIPDEPTRRPDPAKPDMGSAGGKRA